MPFEKTRVITEQELEQFALELLRRGWSEEAVRKRVAEASDGIVDAFAAEVIDELDKGDIIDPEVIGEIADMLGDLVRLAVYKIRIDPAKRALRRARRVARREKRQARRS